MTHDRVRVRPARADRGPRNAEPRGKYYLALRAYPTLLDQSTMNRQRLGAFHVVEHISSGPSGDVYACVRSPGEARVIVKMLHASAAADTRARFEREAWIYGRLRTPHTPRLLERGEIERAPYFVLERVIGPTLREAMGSGECLHLDSAANLARALFVALAGVHAAGIVHRDVKPENVVVCSPPAVAVVDFGVASGVVANEHAEASLTTEDAVLGTLAYAAPEQVDNASATVAGDLYAAGVIVYELLSGRLPFEGPTGAAILAMKRCREASRISSWVRGLPPGVDELVALLLARAPERRPASAARVVELLDQCMVQR